MPDHGEDVFIGDHDASTFTYDMARIPFVVWASEHFARSNPDRINALRSNSKGVFTNDLLYELLIGLTGVQTTYYEEEYDPSSPKYSLTSGSAMTLHGAKMVRDDPKFDFRLAMHQGVLGSEAHKPIRHVHFPVANLAALGPRSWGAVNLQR